MRNWYAFEFEWLGERMRVVALKPSGFWCAVAIRGIYARTFTGDQLAAIERQQAERGNKRE